MDPRAILNRLSESFSSNGRRTGTRSPSDGGRGVGTRETSAQRGPLLGSLYRYLGIPNTLFAARHVVGWCAHVARANNKISRRRMGREPRFRPLRKLARARLRGGPATSVRSARCTIRDELEAAARISAPRAGGRASFAHSSSSSSWAPRTEPCARLAGDLWRCSCRRAPDSPRAREPRPCRRLRGDCLRNDPQRIV